MYETADIRKNLKVVIDGAPWVVIDFQHVKPGKGNAFTRTRLKNMITGNVLDRTYKTGERLEPAALEEHDMQFLYKEGDRYHFMNNATYEQVELDDDHVGDAKNWITENLSVKILYFRDQPIGVTPPNFVELEVIESDPGLKGDTATGATKPAKLSTGATIFVPLFVKQGDWLQIDTRTAEYLRRVPR
jgi:elongation factor P